MAKDKRLPFFKFDTDDWLTGKIQLVSQEYQGTFVNLLALLWRENGVLKNDRFLAKKLKVPSTYLEGCLTDLKELEIIIEKDGFLSVKFITLQLEKHLEYLKKCSEAGKKSAEIKKVPPTKKKEERRKEKEDNTLNPPLPPAGDDIEINDNFLIQAAERILKKHPKAIMPTQSAADVKKAIQKVFDNPPVKTIEEAIAFIEERTELYASIVEQWPQDQHRFITGSNNWYAGGGYFEDEKIWMQRIPASKKESIPVHMRSTSLD
jgi:hypothetical protein